VTRSRGRVVSTIAVRRFGNALASLWRRTGERDASRSAIASRSRDVDSTRNSRRRAIAFERRVKASRDKRAARFTVGDSRGCLKIPARKKFRCSAAETCVLLFQVSLTWHGVKSVPREVVRTNRRLPTPSYIRENRPIRGKTASRPRSRTALTRQQPARTRLMESP